MAGSTHVMKGKSEGMIKSSGDVIIRETTPSGLNVSSDDLYEARAAFQEVIADENRPLVSIMILGFNNLHKHTQYCIESILKYTNGIDYELVLIDNGSSDGTFEYFKSVPHEKKKIVRVTHNQGANFGVHLGLPYLRGKYSVIIANDVYVTPNWLSNIIRCAESDKRIGFVATASDNISNLQSVNLSFASLDEMRLKAEQYNVSDPRKWEERLRLMPAIAFIRRECLDIVGSLDYVFEHDFSDDDLSIRIRRAGYKLVFCGDVFVHHAGASVTGATTKQKIDLLNTGRAIFRQKYYGVDAWDDINNFELLMLSLVNPEEMRGKSKPRILGIDVRCGTPILQLKNKLRLADMFDTELSAFVQDPQYWLDLKTICEGKVVVDRIEFLSEHFSPNSFDYILLGNPLNAYPGSDKILKDIMSLLKSEGQLLIKFRNHFDPHVFFKSAGKDYPNDNKSVSYSDIDNLNQVLMQHGYVVKNIRLSLQPLDDATKEAVCAVIKQTCTDDKIEATFRELTAEEYALRILKSDQAQDKALMNKSSGSQQEKETDLASDSSLYCRFHQAAISAGMTSIVVLTHNQLDQTKKCLKSIRKRTPESHEIIFVDNASTDGTSKWLQVQVKENKNYSLIENKEEGGYAARINQGITRAQGEYILLLSNGVVVSTDWLKGMTGCLNTAPDAGIVGPMANKADGIQQINAAADCAADRFDGYALTFREKHLNRRISSRNLSDFCLLFRRQLVEKIGLLDGQFTTADLAVEDFCLRGALKGHTNYIAGDVFILNREETKNPFQRSAIEKKWTLTTASNEGRELLVLKARELAADLQGKGKADQAIEALIDCIKIISDHAAIYYEMIRIFMELKKFLEAWEVVASMPDHAKDALKGLEYAAYIKEGLGLDDDAASYVDRMIALDADYAPALNLKGVLTYKKGKEEQAADSFKKAITSDPGFGEAYTNLGVVHWRAGKNEDAFSSLRKGFNLSPAVPDTGAFYYSVVSALDCFSEAETDFKEACTLFPHNKSLAFLYIDVLLQQGKLHAALVKIEDALAVFGLDEGTLRAALDVREKIGPRRIDPVSKPGSLSLCMIVKNEEPHLVRCLHSVRDIADEIIIVDTGSTDQTIDIAKVFGARVFEFPWTGDFSEARNHSLKQAVGDWILILDADEVLSPLDFKELKRLIQGPRETPKAYMVITRNYVNNVSLIGWTKNTADYPEEAGRGWVPSGKVRLFTNHKNVYFSGYVHEVLEASLMKAKIPILPAKIIVHHYGKLSQEQDFQKGEDYYLLGKLKYEQDPTNMKNIMELAKQAHTLHRHEEAVDLWLNLLDLIAAAPESEEVKELASISFGDPKAEIYIQLASSYLLLDRFDDAVSAARKAMNFEMSLKEYISIYAHCEIISGSLEQAQLALENLSKEAPDYPPTVLLLSVINCIQGHKSRMEEGFRFLLSKDFKITPGLNMVARQLYKRDRINDASAIVTAIIENRLSDEETLAIRDALFCNQNSA